MNAEAYYLVTYNGAEHFAVSSGGHWIILGLEDRDFLVTQVVENIIETVPREDVFRYLLNLNKEKQNGN